MSAAKKHAEPPRVEYDDENDDFECETYTYFAIKVLPNALTIPAAKRKLMEKQTADESKIQLSILEKVIELNKMLKGKSSLELTRNPSCKSLYNTLINLQTSQHFSGLGWKAVAFPAMIPMTHDTQIFVSLVYYTKSCPLFFKWSLSEMLDKPVHPDLILNPVMDIGDVEQQNESPLVQNPTHCNINEPDWPKYSNLERDLNNSSSSSIDGGTTIVPSRDDLPVLDANDISCLNLSVFDDLTPNSLVDTSYIPINPVKRRLNLSKVDKLKILEIESMAQKIQSTPVQTKPAVHRPNSVRPNLTKTFKRSIDYKNEKPQKETPKNYLTRFLAGWFQKQLPNISAEIESELKNLQN